MKAQRFLKLTTLVVAAVMLASCSSIRNLLHKSGKSQDGGKRNMALLTDTLQKDAFLQQVADNAQTTRFITSKVKFSVEVGNRQMTLTGNLKKFTTDVGVDHDVVISYENDVLSYRWLTERETARIKMANVLYANHLRGNYQLNWDYDEFKANNRKMFPMKHKVQFNTPDKEVKFEMILNYMGNDEDWEPRTTLSGKYRQMPVDEILRRFMSL